MKDNRIYKVGDKVILLKPKISKPDDAFLWTSKMDKYNGETATITKVCLNYYEIDLDSTKFGWISKFFKHPLVKFKIRNYD